MSEAVILKSTNIKFLFIYTFLPNVRLIYNRKRFKKLRKIIFYVS